LYCRVFSRGLYSSYYSEVSIYATLKFQKSTNKLSNTKKWKTEGGSSMEMGSANKSRHDRKAGDGVFVETTVTLREESPDRESDRKLQTSERAEIKWRPRV